MSVLARLLLPKDLFYRASPKISWPRSFPKPGLQLSALCISCKTAGSLSQGHCGEVKTTPKRTVFITKTASQATRDTALPGHGASDQDGLESTGQLDGRGTDNPTACWKPYRRHRLNVNQKEESADHHHINGLGLASSTHYCLERAQG